VQGFVSSGFEAVAEAFEENFRHRGELGAAFAAVAGGELVVDLWRGTADRYTHRPFDRDTLQVVFSGSKGFVAVCMLILIDRDLLDLEASVARYWPEFGKPGIRVRDVVGHTARLPGIEARISIDELTDDRKMSALLAAQAQSADPRAALCYHALTYGWLCDELVRRVDGRSIGRFFAEEIARPLDLDLWIGLPADQERRVATLELSPEWGKSEHLDRSSYARDPLMRIAWGNPEVFGADSFPWNRPDFHRAEIPGANAVGTARSIARLYGCLAEGGRPILSEKAVGFGRQTLSEGFDQLNDEYRRFGVGFALQTETSALGPPPDAFGHSGAGGSMHGAWPTQRVGYSYAMNLMRDGVRPDPRNKALLDALYQAVTGRAGPSAQEPA
jgi:CubicO group peptidase (beta-lactamase class C family)